MKRLILLLLAMSAFCSATITRETSAANFDSSGTPVSTYPASALNVTGLTGGETIAIFSSWGNVVATATPSDTGIGAGSIVSTVGPFTPAGGNEQQIWCEKNAAAGTHGFQITLTGGTTTFPTLWVMVFAGTDTANPCHNAGGTGGGSGTALTSSTWTTTSPNEMIVAFGASFGGGAMSAGTSPITFTADSAAPGCNCLAEYGLLPSAGTASASFTDNSSNSWGMAALSLKPAPVAASPVFVIDSVSTVRFQPVAAPLPGMPIVWEDDCSSDICAPTLATAARLESRGEANILAVAGSTSNLYSEGALFAYLKYYKLSSVPVGAFKGGATNDSTSAYTQTISDAFGNGPGGTSSNYPDCVTVYRTALADATYRSVTLVETGLPTCTVGLLNSAADSISPLTGAQLIQQKVKQLSVMGGKYPSSSGSPEFNFAQDAADMHALVTTWTTQNGYPPIYFTGFDSGTGVLAGPPSSPPDTVNPVLKEYHILGYVTREQWDALAMLYAIRGLSFGGTTYFTDNGDGTLTVDATTGDDTWSGAVHSGHHYLTNADTTADLSALFNGFLAEIP